MMAKLMMSWMVQKYRAVELKAFRADFSKHCLVWEPGAWRPPSKSGGTVAVAPSEQEPAKGKAGDALAIVLEDKGEGGVLKLGRDAAADLLVDDATVSAAHLEFTRKGDTWFVRNPGSTNGSWLNGKPMENGVDMPLAPSDRLRVGLVHLTYYDPKGLYFRLKAG
jgi:pSer/pThr/pTyr-binding forkhead associated (FHA) protein